MILLYGAPRGGDDEDDDADGGGDGDDDEDDEDEEDPHLHHRPCEARHVLHLPAFAAPNQCWGSGAGAKLVSLGGAPPGPAPTTAHYAVVCLMRGSPGSLFDFVFFGGNANSSNLKIYLWRGAYVEIGVRIY